MPSRSTSSAETVTLQPLQSLHLKSEKPLLFRPASFSTAPLPTNILARIPPDSWDSHMHIVDPINYPLAPDAAYIPRPHLLSHALSFESAISLSNIVIVQPSIYGYDNNCLLDALRALGPSRGRGVVAFDPDTTTPETLHEWHQLGVRGARINLKSTAKAVQAAKLTARLRQYADLIRPLGWTLQLWVDLETVQVLAPILADLDLKVVLDHFGGPTLLGPGTSAGVAKAAGAGDPYAIPGFAALIHLLRQGNTYVKLSAPYRLSRDAELRDLEPLAKEILRVAGKTRVVFATDWPHTRFDGLDIKPFAEKCLEWCGEDKCLIERLFRGNAEDLWSVER